MHLNMLSAKWRLFPSGGDELKQNLSVLTTVLKTEENYQSNDSLGVIIRAWHLATKEHPTMGPFHKQFFYHISNSMEIPLCSHPCCNEVIAMKFCTGYNSCAVLACAKFCSDMIHYRGVTWKSIFHLIQIMMEKSFVLWEPGLNS